MAKKKEKKIEKGKKKKKNPDKEKKKTKGKKGNKTKKKKQYDQPPRIDATAFGSITIEGREIRKVL